MSEKTPDPGDMIDTFVTTCRKGAAGPGFSAPRAGRARVPYIQVKMAVTRMGTATVSAMPLNTAMMP